jgi:hypothetical protein
MKVKVQIFNPQKTMRRILDDDVGIFMAQTCARYMDKYVPKQQGYLTGNLKFEPFAVIYNSPFAHYLYNGRAMVSPNGSAWAKSGETKHYSGKDLEFSKEQNAFARSHWDVPVQKNNRVKIASEVTQYINR